MEFKMAKQILNKNRDKELTDEEIIEILKFIEVLAEISVNNFLKIKDKINNNN
jgi:hypothetical protein